MFSFTVRIIPRAPNFSARRVRNGIKKGQRVMKRLGIGPWWSGVAVLGALCGNAGAADGEPDAAVKELTQPQNSIEASVGDVTKASYKFGEYNGLENHGVFGNGAFDLRSQQARSE